MYHWSCNLRELNFHNIVICVFMFCSVINLVYLTNLNEQVYKNRIFRILEDPSDSLALIRNEDQLVAYRLPKDGQSSQLIVYVHQQLET